MGTKIIENISILSKEDLLKYMTLIIEASPITIYDSWKELKDWDKVKDMYKWAIDSIEIEKTFEKDGTPIERIKVKMQPKTTAMQLLAKHHKVGEGAGGNIAEVIVED